MRGNPRTEDTTMTEGRLKDEEWGEEGRKRKKKGEVKYRLPTGLAVPRPAISSRDCKQSVQRQQAARDSTHQLYVIAYLSDSGFSPRSAGEFHLS
jgi:hypothetical protein